jgi:ABC-type branched-subunit amino acid transport system substrate-binding protein
MGFEGRSTRSRLGLAGLLVVGLSWGAGCRHERPVTAAASPAEVTSSGGPADPAAADRGRQIYRTGASPSGRPIWARYGEPATVVAASLLVCANCHGDDGLGRPEGGIEPTDITWGSLTRPYAVTAGEGRRRPPYADETLRRAITLGFDPGGAVLAPAMPRYQITRADLNDLVAYLKTLGTAKDPGITEESIRIGVLLATGPLASSVGEPVREALSSFFDRINEQGGVFGRRIELRFADAASPPRLLTAGLVGEPVFALLSPFAAGIEDALSREAAEAGVPVIGPLTVFPRPDAREGRFIFYLDAGLEGQSRALIQFAAGTHRAAWPRAALVHFDSPQLRPVVEAIRDECRRAGWSGWQDEVVAGEDPGLDRVAARLQGAGAAVVFALGLGDGAGRLLDAAAALGWAPMVLIPGSHAGRSVFEPHAGFRGRVLVALPSLPSDQTPEAVEEYRDLARRRPLAPRHRATHWSALAAAHLLVEGLRRSGRNPDRERLIAALESIREFRTGYSPPLTFGPSRRVGARGSYLLDITPATGQPGAIVGWRDLDRDENERPALAPRAESAAVP